MTNYTASQTIILTNGKIILAYENGYAIRTLQSAAGVRAYGAINELPKGYRYWKQQALDYLGCTIDDIAAITKGSISFMH